MAKVISIGNQSFESMRERDNFYVDNNFNFENGISIEVKKTDRFISDHGCCFLNIQNP